MLSVLLALLLFLTLFPTFLPSPDTISIMFLLVCSYWFYVLLPSPSSPFISPGLQFPLFTPSPYSPLQASPLSFLSSSASLTHCSSPLSPCLVLPALGLTVAVCTPIPGPPLQTLDWCRVGRFRGLQAPPAPRLSQTTRPTRSTVPTGTPLPTTGKPLMPHPKSKDPLPPVCPRMLRSACLCTHTSPVS